MHIRCVVMLMLAAGLAACGLAETGAVAAAGGASAAEEAKQARQQLDKVQTELDAAQKAAAEQRAAMDAAAQ